MRGFFGKSSSASPPMLLKFRLALMPRKWLAWDSVKKVLVRH
jgi:hypothetical protein